MKYKCGNCTSFHNGICTIGYPDYHHEVDPNKKGCKEHRTKRVADERCGKCRHIQLPNGKSNVGWCSKKEDDKWNIERACNEWKKSKK